MSLLIVRRFGLLAIPFFLVAVPLEHVLRLRIHLYSARPAFPLVRSARSRRGRGRVQRFVDGQTVVQRPSIARVGRYRRRSRCPLVRRRPGGGFRRRRREGKRVIRVCS